MVDEMGHTDGSGEDEDNTPGWDDIDVGELPQIGGTSGESRRGRITCGRGVRIEDTIEAHGQVDDDRLMDQIDLHPNSTCHHINHHHTSSHVIITTWGEVIAIVGR